MNIFIYMNMNECPIYMNMNECPPVVRCFAPCHGTPSVWRTTSADQASLCLCWLPLWFATLAPDPAERSVVFARAWIASFQASPFTPSGDCTGNPLHPTLQVLHPLSLHSSANTWYFDLFSSSALFSHDSVS